MRRWSGRRSRKPRRGAADSCVLEDAALPQLNEAFPYLGLEPVRKRRLQSWTERRRRSGAGEDAAAQTDATESALRAMRPTAEAEAKRAAKLREREARGAIKQVLDELIAE